MIFIMGPIISGAHFILLFLPTITMDMIIAVINIPTTVLIISDGGGRISGKYKVKK